MKIIAANKKGSFDYFINEKFEAGLVLTGSEVKSLRFNSGSIKEAYINEKNGELWLTNCHIKHYSSSSDLNNDPIRERKLLVHKKQLNNIIGSFRKEGMAIIPLKLYFNDKGIAKLTIGLGKGKKKQDKRESIKNREWGKNQQRLLKNRSK